MLVSRFDSISADAIRGSILTNPNGAQFYVLGVELDLTTHKVKIVAKNCDDGSVCGLFWDLLTDWGITVQSALWMED
jgi:hypothetical protein